MKHLFKILFATVFLSVFSLINLGYAAPPGISKVYQVSVTVNNSGGGSLYYQN